MVSETEELKAAISLPDLDLPEAAAKKPVKLKSNNRISSRTKRTVKKTKKISARKKKTAKKKTPAKKTKTKKQTPKKTTRKTKTSKAKPTTFKLKNEKEIAMDFAAKVHKRFAEVVKATILFGSQAQGKGKTGSDIDIIIIVDDAGLKWDLELIAWYREELAKLIAANPYGRDLHVNTVKLTTWWNDLMHGDPVIINILRYGQTLIDIGGFFKPQKALLLQGKIHATPEAVYAALQRAPTHLARSNMAELAAVEGVYWAMVDSAQAALITLGRLPSSPEHLPRMIKTSFVDSGMLKMEYVKWLREIYDLHKGIAHGAVKNIKGLELDELQERAEKFLLEMTKIIDKLIDARKKE